MPRVIDRAGAEIYAACHAQGRIAFNLDGPDGRLGPTLR
jgi:hypothetical protein